MLMDIIDGLCMGSDRILLIIKSKSFLHVLCRAGVRGKVYYNRHSTHGNIAYLLQMYFATP